MYLKTHQSAQNLFCSLAKFHSDDFQTAVAMRFVTMWMLKLHILYHRVPYLELIYEEKISEFKVIKKIVFNKSSHHLPLFVQISVQTKDQHQFD